MPRAKRGEEARTASKVMKQLFAIYDRSVMTRYDVQAALGVTPTAVSYWRSGRSAPHILTVEEFADLLGYEIKLVKKEIVDVGA